MEKLEPKIETKSESEKEIIRVIENGPIDFSQDQTDILLILQGLKPATDISISSGTWREGEKKKEIDPKKIKEVEELLNKTNLPHELFSTSIVGFKGYQEGNKLKWEKKKRMRFVIAKDRENLELIKKGLETENDELLGKAYGFPQTAIDAYTGKKKMIKNINRLPEDEFPKNVSRMAFVRFKLSKDNWREELKLCKKWADAVKKASPKLYKEFYEKKSPLKTGSPKS